MAQAKKKQTVKKAVAAKKPLSKPMEALMKSTKSAIAEKHLELQNHVKELSDLMVEREDRLQQKELEIAEMHERLNKLERLMGGMPRPEAEDKERYKKRKLQGSDESLLRLLLPEDNLVSTQKSFEQSEMHETEEEVEEDMNEEIEDDNDTANTVQQQHEEEQQPQPQQQKKKHSPDFIVKNLHVPKFEMEMEKRQVAVATKILADGQQIVKCSFENRPAVRQWMDENQVRGRTSTCNSDRVGVAIVKGIHRLYDPDYVKDFLEKILGDKLLKVRPFQEKLQQGEKELHWWIIQAVSKEVIMKARRISKFRNSPIKWEPFLAKKAPRCYRCQEYFHLAKNCFNTPRCALCKHSHEQGKCSLPLPRDNRDGKAVYYCHPCKKTGHWAGDPKCPKKLELDAKLAGSKPATSTKEQSTGSSHHAKNPSTCENVPPQAQSQPKEIDFNVTYTKKVRGPAAAAKSTGGIPQWSRGGAVVPDGNGKGVSAWEQIQAETQQLFGHTALEMMEICDNFTKHYETLNSIAEKKMAQVTFYLKLSQCQG